MKNLIVGTLLSLLMMTAVSSGANSQSRLDTLLPVRGFCIALPTPEVLDEFVNFINTELAPRQVNTLVLRVEYKYKFKSHPELIDTLALSRREIRKIVKACKKNNIRIIPLIDLLGHQSGAKGLGQLLRVYPQFDETPMPKVPDTTKVVLNGFNMKSYCPLHPDVHTVLFDVIDEICDVFESDAFHAGMDEVFDIGNDKCPRCAGRDKADLFAGEVRVIRDHLAGRDRTMWMWGDRFLDGTTTGMGRWEASYNNTHRAIDMIPKDVVICDWHYERPDLSSVYFAIKGLSVMTCPWRNPRSAVMQVEDMVRFRQNSTKQMSERFLGVMETVWSNTGTFLDGFYGRTEDVKTGENTPWDCFRKMYERIAEL
ncbi:MAG: family 20 glycosylhydrolase [Rikenellaceae bacterium]